MYFVKKALYYVGIVVLGYVMYMALNSLFLHILKIELTGYQNLDSMGHISFDNLKWGLFCVGYYFVYSIPDIYPDQSKYAYYALLVTIVILTICVIVKKIKDKKIVTLILFLLSMSIGILAINIIYVSGASVVYNLMLYCHFLLCYVPFILINFFESTKSRKIAVGLICCIVAYMAMFYTSYSNRCYMDETFTQNKTIAWTNQFVASIKSTDGFSDEMQILYWDQPIEDKTFYADTEYDVCISHYGNYEVINTYNFKTFMEKWCGFKMQEVDEARRNEILQREEIQNMPSYPNDGSILIIDNVVVVRL